MFVTYHTLSSATVPGTYPPQPKFEVKWLLYQVLRVLDWRRDNLLKIANSIPLLLLPPPPHPHLPGTSLIDALNQGHLNSVLCLPVYPNRPNKKSTLLFLTIDSSMCTTRRPANNQHHQHQLHANQRPCHRPPDRAVPTLHLPPAWND